jgi:hypothetical protein
MHTQKGVSLDFQRKLDELVRITLSVYTMCKPLTLCATATLCESQWQRRKLRPTMSDRSELSSSIIQYTQPTSQRLRRDVVARHSNSWEGQLKPRHRDLRACQVVLAVACLDRVSGKTCH